MATLIFGAAGALVGGSLAGPAGALKGFEIGSALGSFFDRGPSVGKLNDLMISGSVYGTDFPRAWGNVRVPGQFVWAKQDANGNVLVPHSGSKKKGGPTVYRYSATFAIAFNQSSLYFPDPANPLGGVLSSRSTTLVRLHADGKVVTGSYTTYNLGTYNTYNATYWTSGHQFNWHSGTDPQTPDTIVISGMAVSSANAPAFPGLAYAVFNDVGLQDFGNRVPNLEAEISTTGGAAANVSDVYFDLLRMAGVPAANIDVSAVAGTVDGVLLSTRSSPSQAVQTLNEFFANDLVEVDGLIRILPRGGSPVLTVSAFDLGASSGNSQDAVNYKRTRKDTSTLPGRIDLEYFDDSLLRQAGSQSAIRPGTYAMEQKRITVPFSMAKSDAAQGAYRYLDRIWSEIEYTEISLPPKYLSLAPGDVILIPVAEGNKRYRIVDMEIGPLAEIHLKTYSDGSQVLSQVATGDSGGGALPSPPAIVPSVWEAWSGTEIQDADQGVPGFYVGAAPSSGASGWSGAVVWWSTDLTNWIQGPVIQAAVPIGVTTSALGSTGAVALAFDNTNTVAVDFTNSGADVAGATDDEVLSGGYNQFKIGSEYLGSGTVTLTSANHYTFSHLYRGERATPMTGHVVGEPVVQIQSPGIVRVAVANSLIGQNVYVKAVSFGQALTDVTTYQTVTIATPTPSGLQSLGTTVAGITGSPTFLSPQLTPGQNVANYGTWYTISGPAAAKHEVLIQLSSLGNSGLIGILQARATGGSEVYDLINSSSSSNYVQFWVPTNSSGQFDIQIKSGSITTATGGAIPDITILAYR